MHRATHLGIVQGRHHIQLLSDGSDSSLSAQKRKLSTEVPVKVKPHTDVCEFGGLIKNNHLIVKRQVHIWQASVCLWCSAEGQFACKNIHWISSEADPRAALNLLKSVWRMSPVRSHEAMKKRYV